VIPTTKAKSFIQALTCALALSAASPLAHAQLGADLPPSTTEAISISPSQRTQISKFVEAWTSKALSDNPQDIKNALESLTEPLQARAVSVAFRQSYAQAITPLLNELQAKDSIASTLASLRIAANLATPNTTARVKAALNHADQGIQLFAVSRAGQIFKTTNAHGPAMAPNDAVALIKALETLASDPQIQDELLRTTVRALIAATQLRSKDMGDTRSDAIIALANIIGAHLRALNTNDDPAFTQSIALDAASAITASIADISSQTTPDAVKSSVGLGGDIISVALRRVLANTINPVSNRDLTVRSVQAGETLLYFALRKDAETTHRFTGSVKQTNFADLLRAGDDKAFRNQASLLLAPGSPIVKDFGFQTERFFR